jgi:hypothetical protein
MFAVHVCCASVFFKQESDFSNMGEVVRRLTGRHAQRLKRKARPESDFEDAETVPAPPSVKPPPKLNAPAPNVPRLFEKKLAAPQKLEETRKPQLESICLRCKSACENGRRVPPWAQRHDGVLAVKRAIENKECLSVRAAERFHFETCVLPVMASILKAQLYVLDPADIDDDTPDPMNNARLWATTALTKGLKVLLVRSFESMPAKYASELRNLAENIRRSASIVVQHAVNTKRSLFPNNEVRLYASRSCPVAVRGDEFDDVFKGAEKAFAHKPGNYSADQLQLVIDTELDANFETFAPRLSEIDCLPISFKTATVPLSVQRRVGFQKMSNSFQKNASRNKKKADVDTFLHEIGSRNPRLSRDDMFYLSIIGCFDIEARESLTLPENVSFKDFRKKVRPILLS